MYFKNEGKIDITDLKNVDILEEFKQSRLSWENKILKEISDLENKVNDLNKMGLLAKKQLARLKLAELRREWRETGKLRYNIRPMVSK